MAFSVPTFPITCNLWRGPWLTRVFADNLDCNLANGRRGVQSNFWEPEFFSGAQNVAQLLLPALSDVRDASNAPEPDVVEVPAFSGRWYIVLGFDDVGKGFPNEYRIAYITKIYETLNPTNYAGLVWPAPCP